MTTHKTGTREEWLAARIELLEFLKNVFERRNENARWIGHRASCSRLASSLDASLEHAEHNGADEGEGDIRGNNAQSADESHGNAPLVHVVTATNAEG